MRSSPGVDTTELRDQLFSCPNEKLRTALYRSHRVNLSTITMADLVNEIKKVAVVRQSNNVHTLDLMLALQRDAPVRQFAARLKVSEVDKWVRMSLYR